MSEEERLQAAVFGEDEDGLLSDASEEYPDEEFDDVQDADLFMVDDGPGDVDLPEYAPVTANTQPAAWHDSDDESLSISLATTPKLRKLRAHDDEDIVDGLDYCRRLRHHFERVHPVPDWALPSQVRGSRRRASDSDMSDTVEGDPLEMLLRTAQPYTVPTAAIRRPGKIDIKRLRDANDKAPSAAAIQALQFHPSFPLLLTGGFDRTIRLYHIDGKVNQPATSLYLHRVSLETVLFHPDGHRVFAGGRRKFFHVWDLASGHVQRISRLYGHEEEYTSMERFVLSPDGKYMALAGNRGWIGILATGTGQYLDGFKVDSPVADLKWHRDSDCISVIDSSADVYEWSMRGRTVQDRWRDVGGLDPTSLALSPNATAIGSRSGVVNVYSGMSRQPDRELQQLTTSIHAMEFSPDAQILAVSSRAKKDSLRLIHMPSCTVFKNWPTQNTPLGRIGALAWSPTSSMLAIGNDAGRVTLWSV
ncbi:U3 snoRNP protein [Savitreella phatthalungensis]